MTDTVNENPNYYEDHKFCPECGSSSLKVTLKGIIVGIDDNSAICECGWEGICHDLVKEKVI